MIWQDRERTDPTKRKFTDEDGVEQEVHIEEIQSNITQSGTPVNATTMNNIEKNLGTYGNDTYDSTATYSIGDVVTHNALLYRAKQDIDTAEEWTAAHWEETSALDELKKTSGNEVLISDDEGDITYQTKIFVDSDTGTAKYRDTNDSFVPLKDNEVIISNTEPTSTDNEIWVDTSSNATYINSEISNEYGTSQNLGYSQEYINKVTDYSAEEQVIGKWINGKPIYRSVIEYTLSIDTSTYYGTYTGAADLIKSIDTLVDYKFFVYNGTLIFPIPDFGGTNNDRDCGIYIQRSYGGIGFQCFARSINNFNGKPAQIILEYTKTTD